MKIKRRITAQKLRVNALDLVRQGRVDYVPGESFEDLLAKEEGGADLIEAYRVHEEKVTPKKLRFTTAVLGLQAHLGNVFELLPGSLDPENDVEGL